MSIQKSLAMQERARNRIPGMTQLLSKRPDMFAEGIWPAYYQKADGVEVWDLDGNRYIDMSISGIGANVLGYADPDVDQAILEAISNGTSCSLNCPEEVELAELLCELHPWAEMVRFSRTGGESMAIAVRIARAHTGRDKIAFCGYHGWHDWYLAANLNSEEALDDHLLPGLSPLGVPSGLSGTAIPFHYNQLQELEAVVSKNRQDIAAIVMEPIRSEKPHPAFLEGVRSIADDIGAVLVIDEISAGFRTNTGGAHLNLGLEPDIAVFSKALGNGYPIGAIIGNSSVMDTVQKTFISSTCWTERIGPVAALACIKKHKEVNAGACLTAIGQQVQDGWRRCGEQNELKIQVSGIPPLSHFTFEYENALSVKALFIQLMLEKGFLASNLFYAMVAHQSEHVVKYIQAVDESFSFIREVLENGTLETHLKGKPSGSGFKRLT